MANDCIFCRIVAGEAPGEKVYETDAVYAFRDTNPQAPTHILIVPKKHIPRVSEVEAEDAALMGELLLAARAVAEKEGVSGGFRLVVNNGSRAGQTVYHVHLHLLAGRAFRWPPG